MEEKGGWVQVLRRREFWLALLVTACLLLATQALWQRSLRGLAEEQAAELSERARELEELWRTKLAKAELLLRGLRGFWDGSSEVSEAEFDAYVEALRLDRTNPHVGALGFVIEEQGRSRWLLLNRRSLATASAGGGAAALAEPVLLQAGQGMPGEVQLAGVDAKGLFLLLPAAVPFERAAAAGAHVYALVYLDAEALLKALAQRLGRLQRFDILPLPGGPAQAAGAAPGQLVRVLSYAGRHWQLRVAVAPVEAHAGPYWLAGLGLFLSLSLGLLTWAGLGHARRQRAWSEELDRRVRELTLDLNATLDAVPDLLFEMDLNGRYLHCRASRPELLVVPPAAFIGRTVQELLPAAAAAEVLQALAEADREGQSHGRCIQLEVAGGPHCFEFSVARKLSLAGPRRFVVLSRDVSERVAAQLALEASGEVLAEAQGLARLGHFRIRPGATQWEASATCLELLGLPPTQGLDLERLCACVEPGWQASLRAWFRPPVGVAVRREIELPIRAAGAGPARWMLLVSSAEHSDLFILQDIDARKQTELELAESGQRYRRLFADNPVPMWVYELDSLRFLDVNDAAIRQYGFSRAEFLSMSLRDIRPAEDVPALERNVQAQRNQSAGRPEQWRHRRKDGSLFPVEITAHAIEFGGRAARLVLAMDISERARAERQISTMAYYDALTGLPNRTSFEQAAAAALARCQAERGCGAAILIDLDHFKVVNDYWGHRSGDEMLAVVGQRLRDQLPDGALLYRLGGDEFLVLMTEGCEDLTQAAAMAQDCCRRIHDALRAPIAAHGREHYSSASMGIALIGEKRLEVGELLSQADAAMYLAKGQGRNTYCFFDQGLQRSLARRTELEAELRLALERNELHLVYQPQVDSQGRLLGAEALLRWTHPTQGPVSPTEFIPLAENSGLILPIGNWVLINACRTLAAWQANPDSAQLCLAVNVSAKQFHSADFQQQVLSALQLSGARASGLKLELTESILAVDLDGIVQKMLALKRHGLSFALDDFGTGYSSLNYLKRLPLDQLKIDQSFVRELLDNRHDAAIVRTVIALGESLGLEVIAEGVETEAHREALQREGCQRFQGFLFSRPLPLAAWEQFFTAWRAGKDAVRSAAR